MNTKVMIEIFGYIGSTLVVVSMLMSSVVRLRIINTAGSIVSATYALIIRSYPLALMNICLIIINIYQLIRLNNTEKHYSLIEGSGTDSYLAYLLKYYGEDIKKFFPDFSFQDFSDGMHKVFVVCCDNEVAGLLIGTQKGSELEIALDYSTPVYRDCSVGAYIYNRLHKYGIAALSCESHNQMHINYMEKMGFGKDSTGRFFKKL